MNHLKANELKYTTGVTCLIEASERLRSLPTLALGNFNDLIDAEIIASAYEQIAEALESLQEVGVPFETIEKRLSGIPLQGEVSREHQME